MREAVLAEDALNCGNCGVSALESPNVVEAGCSDGTPTITACEPGFANCDDNWATGCEASTDADETCGSACTDCTTLGGTGVALECRLAGTSHICSSAGCDPGRANCDGDVSTCETDIAGDPNNCGGCEIECTAPAGATATCTGGECGFVCDSGLDACSGECVDLQTSDEHCSECGEGCGAGEACSNGFCICATNFTNCDGDCVDDFQSNRDHCGECNNACGTRGACSDGDCACEENHTFCRVSVISTACCNNASEVCEPSSLRFGNCECASGYGDCSGEGEPRDCRNLQSDRNNCGSCGHQCPVAQRCVRGTCGF